MIQSAILLLVALALASRPSSVSHAFNTNYRYEPRTPLTRHHSTRQRQQQQANDPNDWLEDFKLFNGEVVNPYSVLGVPRQAERTQIRQQYLKMSKRYHPDAARQRDILPGSCNNDDEVREEWERIKFSYEILTDKRLRKKFDRHEVLADPQAAMKRAAFDAAGNAAAGLGKGLFSVGKGLFNMGAKAVSTSAKVVVDSVDNKSKEQKPGEKTINRRNDTEASPNPTSSTNRGALELP